MNLNLRALGHMLAIILIGCEAQAVDVTCPGTPPPSPALGVCSVTPGNTTLRLQGNLLAPDGVLSNGQMIIGANGLIACVACDCASHPDFATATRIECPQGVISPGLIDGLNRLNFSQNPPATASTERYEHRHDWRIGQNGHMQISASVGASTDQMRWGELRALLAGTTSIASGLSSASGLTRNLGTSGDAAALASTPWNIDTFPLNDSNGTYQANCANYSYLTADTDIETWIVAEGINSNAQHEWACLTGQWTPQPDGPNRVEPEPLAGLLGMTAQDVNRMALLGASATWTARYNVRLYGDPGPVTLFDRLEIPIMLATNWTVTGSMNLLRELTCADDLTQTYLGAPFSDRQLWEMVTHNPAQMGGFGAAIGALAPGLQGDIAIFNAQTRSAYRAVIDAQAQDVVLVLKSGLPVNGDATLLTALGHATCEDLNVCGVNKKVCVARETGNATTLATLTLNVGSTYGLFFCGTPPSEPSCLPARPAANNNSTIYTGTISANDGDGDGIVNALDNCPGVFNPIRPMDASEQADIDGDMVGDVCDVCPLAPGTSDCEFLFGNSFE